LHLLLRNRIRRRLRSLPPVLVRFHPVGTKIYLTEAGMVVDAQNRGWMPSFQRSSTGISWSSRSRRLYRVYEINNVTRDQREGPGGDTHHSGVLAEEDGDPPSGVQGRSGHHPVLSASARVATPLGVVKPLMVGYTIEAVAGTSRDSWLGDSASRLRDEGGSCAIETSFEAVEQSVEAVSATAKNSQGRLARAPRYETNERGGSIWMDETIAPHAPYVERAVRRQ